MCDTNYCLTVGGYGSNDDSGILASSEFGERFEDRKMNFPTSEKLDGCDFSSLPYLETIHFR